MIKSNVISGAVCFAFGAFAFWLAQSVPPITLTDSLGGRFFPQIISVLFMLASAGLVITGLMGIEISGGTMRQSGPDEAETVAAPSAEAPRFGPGEYRLAGFLATMLAYTLVLPLLGYIVSSVLTFAALIAIAGERRPLRVMGGAATITAMLYVLFAVVFNMNVPEASLF